MARKDKRRSWQIAEHRDAKSKRLSEGELRRKLRSNDLSGMELARAEGSEAWVELHALPIFAEEIPIQGDARRAALRREGRSFVGHAAIWAAVLGVTGGYADWWGWIWGAFVGYHAYRALPYMWELWRSRRTSRADPPEQRTATEGPPELAAFAREARRVRELVAERGGAAREDLSAAVDELEAHVRELFEKERELADLTRDEAERGSRAQEPGIGEGRRTRGGEASGDIALGNELRRMAAARRQALDQASRALEDLRVRRRLAEDQVRLLRLELTSLDAARSGSPDHRERLDAMRHELGALQELDATLGEAAIPAGGRELEG